MRQLTESATADGRPGSPDSWEPDWARFAERIVDESLQLARGERVIYLTDPYLYPALLDHVRDRVLARGGVEQATILAWTPRLSARRTVSGLAIDPELREAERQAHRRLFDTADVFIWLPPTTFDRPGCYSVLEAEWIIDRWPGRSIHFHWPLDPMASPDAPINGVLQRMGERAVLELDYEAHALTQQRLVQAIRGGELHITTPAGTSLRMTAPADGWYYANDGRCGPGQVDPHACGRDRTQELPAGVVRMIPDATLHGRIVLNEPVTFDRAGLLESFASDLTIEIEAGMITRLRSPDRQDELDERVAGLSGDWRAVSELVIGTNPLISSLAGESFPPYWGYQAGLVRLHFGDNMESGGRWRSPTPLHTFIPGATLRVGGVAVVADGELTR